MLSYCNVEFTKIFEEKEALPTEESKKDLTDKDEMKRQQIALEDEKERQFKQKEKLFGNINFIALLYIEYLLPEKIAFQILFDLLRDKEPATNDKLEAALNFMNTIGPALEERIITQKKTQLK